MVFGSSKDWRKGITMLLHHPLNTPWADDSKSTGLRVHLSVCHLFDNEHCGLRLDQEMNQYN